MFTSPEIWAKSLCMMTSPYLNKSLAENRRKIVAERLAGLLEDQKTN